VIVIHFDLPVYETSLSLATLHYKLKNSEVLDAQELILVVLNQSNLPVILSFGKTCSAV
jgi:hypothetical protein